VVSVQAFYGRLLLSNLVKHLARYLDEFEVRFNNRNSLYLFRDTRLRLINAANLEYKELIKEELT
jgi:hypothetical protein